ncbi:putative serine protease PepD [Motilibacter rhizosphaerae]|uniref:Putative serine protease PepD n=1 Tax=Motilibacter rhizosphaerae TaxID=598652 RepID=A0A4Q7NWU8_9ACTN|nr:trypsin-like peptidase domain-containing protein [Motilibacter rhizosphaerae]RZS91811.1 putative serine protease PepD [Motilibacter rhizosphaerae]
MDEHPTQPNQPNDPQHPGTPSQGVWWVGADGTTAPHQPVQPQSPQPAPQQPERPAEQTQPQPWSQPQHGQPQYGPSQQPVGPHAPYGAYPATPYAPAGDATSVYAFPAASPSAERRSGGASWARRGAAAAVLALVAVGSGTAGAAIAGHDSRSSSASPAAVATAAPAAATAPVQSLAKVAAAVTPSVVSVGFTSSQGSGEGSGVILTADGQILTNNHVVAAAAGGGSLTVKFADGKSATATILGRDPSTDLAVIKAQGVSGLTPATLGSSSSLHVGDTVLAIGNPLGLEGSVSAGIVSALHRSVDIPAEEEQQSPQQMFPGFGGGSGSDGSGGSGSGGSSSSSSGTVLKNAIQTDAAVNPGNSGGALVDAAGRVVGINSAIASLSSGSGQSGSIGVGFAIPIDTAKVIAAELAKGQTVQHPVLGVTITDATGGSAGAQIGTVVSGGGADKAGLKAGDVITAVDGSAVRDAEGLQAAISGHQPGQSVSVTYTRGGSSSTTTVTLGSS